MARSQKVFLALWHHALGFDVIDSVSTCMMYACSICCCLWHNKQWW